ncbi:SEC-C metal-binding domain-containing protein [Cytobacillus sp. FSL W7-1323]|uniref:YecA family protein n=1 Tax=Cytobacillus sp. FSL W7-1323 TaxID=2921700 RepID=UPI003159023F
MKKKIKTIKPDDYASYGPIEFAAFGNEVIMRNNMTDEMRIEYINRLVKEYPDVKNKINKLVYEIRDLVSDCNPLLLLHQSYGNNYMAMLGKTSEVNYGFDEIIALRMLDYIQSVIASTEPKKVDEMNKDITEVWGKVYKKVSELYSNLTYYHIVHSAFLESTNPEYNPEYDFFYVQAQDVRTTVRGKRYPVHDIIHHLELLSPHDEVFIELFGINTNEFLLGLEKLQVSLMRGMSDTVRDIRFIMDKTLPVLGESVENTSEDPQEKMDKILAEMGLKDLSESLKGRFMGHDLFDVEKVTNLPKALLKHLSWEVGEDNSFYSEGDFAGWPLRRTPIEERPFISIEGSIYCFDYYSLFDNLYRVIQRLLFRLKPEYKKEWNEKQKIISEQIPFDLFNRLLPNSDIYKSIYYQSKTGNNGKNQWCECDGILIFDDQLLVVEVKGGSFSYTHPTTDFEAFIKSLENLAKKPHEQASRLIETLKNEGRVVVCDEEHNPIKELNFSDYRQITLCSVTIDNFNEFAARIDKLTPLGIDLGEFPSWSISLDELRVYADYFESPSIFLHFLEQRVKASQSPDLEVFDELDHLGLYIKHNFYTKTAESKKGSFKVWHGYREELDNYFASLMFEEMESVEKPQQDVPRKIQEIIYELDIHRRSGFTGVVSDLLNLKADIRKEIEEKMEILFKKQVETKRIMPLSIHGESKITFICNKDGVTKFEQSEARDYVLATMLKPDEENRLALYLNYNRQSKLVNVEFEYLSKDDIPPERASEFIELADKYAETRLLSYKKQYGVKKIGRNDTCPCGSGKKYKRCCGA